MMSASSNSLTRDVRSLDCIGDYSLVRPSIIATNIMSPQIVLRTFVCRDLKAIGHKSIDNHKMNGELKFPMKNSDSIM